MEDDDDWHAPEPDIPPAAFPKFTKPLLSLSFGPQHASPAAPAHDPFLKLAASLGFTPLPSMVVRTVSVDSGDVPALPPQPVVPQQQHHQHTVVEEEDEDAEPTEEKHEESEQFFDASDELPLSAHSFIYCGQCKKVNPVGQRFCRPQCEQEHNKP